MVTSFKGISRVDRQQVVISTLQVFLWPIGLILLSLPFCILTGFNPTRFTLNIYFD